MKKIFFILSTDDFSGAEAVNFSIIENLRHKYEFYWVSRKGKINQFLKDKNVNFIEINELSVREINRIIKQYKPDLIHATDYRASVICAFSKLGKIPLISHVHNNAPWLKKLHPFTFTFLFASCKMDSILTVSDSIKNEFIFSKLISKKIINIGNPIDRQKILNKVKTIKNEKKYDICCVARLAKQKNPQKFIEIINEIKKVKNDLKVVWIGKGELLSQCINKCKELNLEDNIKFIGFQKNPYVYMKQSKIFMLTSDWEGFGLVAFEALTLGLPSVVSNVGGLPSVVNEKCGKLCNENSEYINEVIKLLRDTKYYNSKKNNAILQSKKIENITEYMHQLSMIYDENLN